MEYKRILTVQDISCLGQCSLTVALPVLSGCGQETCILPTAVLSTHTGGFSKPAIRDLTGDLPAICRHWVSEGIAFDAVYTGYLGSQEQIGLVKDLIPKLLRPQGKVIVDPAMADHGKLYAGFDMDFVEQMKVLCGRADVLLPNLTEAAMLTEMPCRESYDEAYVMELLERLHEMGAKSVLLTGVSYEEGKTGVILSQDGKTWSYSHRRLGRGRHGTGDIFAACFVGAWMGGKTMEAASKIAADFVCCCIENTEGDPDHWYGVKFETALPSLIKSIYE